MSLEEQRNKLLKRLGALKLFPNNNLVRQIRKQVKKKLQRVEKKAVIPVVPVDARAVANAARSTKLQKHHRYIRLIRNNFPNISYLKIRQQFSKRKKGQDVSISDAVWQNPSP